MSTVVKPMTDEEKEQFREQVKVLLEHAQVMHEESEKLKAAGVKTDRPDPVRSLNYLSKYLSTAAETLQNIQKTDGNLARGAVLLCLLEDVCNALMEFAGVEGACNVAADVDEAIEILKVGIPNLPSWAIEAAEALRNPQG